MHNLQRDSNCLRRSGVSAGQDLATVTVTSRLDCMEVAIYAQSKTRRRGRSQGQEVIHMVLLQDTVYLHQNV